ncbi:MAG: ATP-NAD kinase family protein [Conexibacteraceae bacterium]|nr:ATP-NAD kinase family protein [Conexibacteraceae bacterium]
MPSGSASRPRLGVIVNPVAGIGGAVALKGSDGPETVALARTRGAVPQAPARAGRALRGLGAGGSLAVLAAPGVMGADLARVAGLAVTPTGGPCEGPTTAEDTRTAATAMRESGVELLLFAGGDGTARDIYDAVGTELALLGIPAGVKMHSGVFAPSPEAAAVAGETFLRLGSRARLRDADIADVDEQAAREGRVDSVLYGAARVPDLPRLVLPTKSGSRTNSGADLEALCAAVAAELGPETLYLLGPGTTTAAVLDALGLRGTLLGVDAIRNERLLQADLTEAQILALLDRHGDDVRLIVGLVGGQGALFGRGNRQLGARVLRRIGRSRITILSAADKLLALDPPSLWVDTGDPELDAELSGYVRVDVAPRRQMVMKVSR